ncbi:DUF6193 family natural product biosynthesis protein [Streptomyces sp. NPDC052107]|uniref:DUF6193 family natural product biosynthesis protein n=1 Tax=Streptomyces sp. NPDC052107 TaxID=3155632 RepID=UPI00341F7CA8
MLIMTDRSASDITETEWRSMLTERYVDQELVRAAYAAPRLRQLFPWTSMWELHFSRCTEHPWSWDVPFIRPRNGGGFEVWGPSRGDFVGEADTAEAAVAMAADQLPSGCGRVVVGNRDALAAAEQKH